ncbi:MAG: formylglycine-generating enzyme family protein [Planctomycetaceae bacterium]|jgi:formylglycine-generating enzyme required for sulfatase activity|nr:formylglycine-generating enzyme family protein [Planctomycetaceae bacterium]
MTKISYTLLSVLLLLTAAPVAAFGQTDAKEKERLANPIFTSSLEWMKTPPVPCADSEAADTKSMKRYVETIPGTKVTFDMIPVQGGKFKLGSPDSEEGRLADEGPQHEVDIQPFWIEEHEVTWKEFSEFALKYLRRKRIEEGKPPVGRETVADAFGAPTAPYNISAISYGKSDKPNCPASGMTYYAAQAYCKWLTSLTGRYYRLPTEAEWEYACRASSSTAFSFGDDAEKLGEYAWFFDNAEEGYMEVKKKKPNAWGLYDMHGNVAEWVCEQYDKDAYKKRAAGDLKTNFVKPKGDFGQIYRGGHCDNDDPADLRSARRVFSTPRIKEQDPMYPQSIWWVTEGPFIGFRIVRPLTPPTADEAAQFEPDPKVWKAYVEQNTRE